MQLSCGCQRMDSQLRSRIRWTVNNARKRSRGCIAGTTMRNRPTLQAGRLHNENIDSRTRRHLGVVARNARKRARECVAGKTMRRPRTTLTKRRSQRAAWMRRNRTKFNTYERRLRQTNPSYAIGKRLRGSIRGSLRRHGAKKARRTTDLLGCSLAYFIHHLESRFLPGMTWDNRHLWHIDHDRPLASFDLTDQRQQKRAFHFSNLQPLWAEDNLAKGSRACNPVPPRVRY